MSQIEIDGYEAIIPNQVYGKDIHGAFGKRVEPYATHVICLFKGRVPTKEEIVNNIVDELNNGEFKEEDYENPFRILYWTRLMSDKFRIDIANREERGVGLLEKAIDEFGTPFPGKMNFTITQASLGIDSAEQLRSKSGVLMEDYYQESVKRGSNFLDIVFALNENGGESKTSMAILRLAPGEGDIMKRGEIIFNRLKKQRIDALENFKQIYTQLSKPEMRELILDQTREVMKITSAGALEYFIKMCVGYKK